MPPGTLVYESMEAGVSIEELKAQSEPIADLTMDGDRFVIAKGGKGGKEKTSTKRCTHSRAKSLTYCEKPLQMKVVQRHLTLDDLSEMTECFLTGTAAEVTPVSQIGDASFTPGDISRQLVIVCCLPKSRGLLQTPSQKVATSQVVFNI